MRELSTVRGAAPFNLPNLQPWGQRLARTIALQRNHFHLATGQSWSYTFTTPGQYTYINAQLPAVLRAA